MLHGEYSLYVGGLGAFPNMLGVWGTSAHLTGFGVWQYIHWVSIMLHLVPFL